MKILGRKSKFCCRLYVAKENCWNSMGFKPAFDRSKSDCAPHHRNHRTKRGVQIGNIQVKKHTFRIVLSLGKKCNHSGFRRFATDMWQKINPRRSPAASRSPKQIVHEFRFCCRAEEIMIFLWKHMSTWASGTTSGDRTASPPTVLLIIRIEEKQNRFAKTVIWCERAAGGPRQGRKNIRK